MQEIEFTIHADGKVEYTIRGIKGSGCDNLADLFSTLGETTETRTTGEYYEQPPEIRTNQITGH